MVGALYTTEPQDPIKQPDSNETMSKVDTRLPLHEAAFIKSAANLHQCPQDVGVEVAFCGRSNAGKSSALNYLTDQRKLARTSKTPGRTQLINFFSVTDSFRLVDLPGYGYAKVPGSIKKAWHTNINAYLQNRESLRGLILVMDVRHPMRDFDLMMLDWSDRADIPIHILLTKADKLKRGAQQATLLRVRKTLPDSVTIQTFSSRAAIGKDILSRQISTWNDSAVK